MLSCEIINNPSKGTIDILRRKVPDQGLKENLACRSIEAVALIQGPIAQIIAAADTAEKSADVMAVEIRGTCPQHITVVALFGTISAVSIAVKEISKKQESRSIRSVE